VVPLSDAQARRTAGERAVPAPQPRPPLSERERRFRERFHLRGRDRGLAQLHGPERLRRHAADIVRQRLAPAFPRNDGKQTPYRGHPVFVAQHATATCCRSCLARHHGIPPGAELTPEQQEYVVNVISDWIADELSSGPA
jgi:hypothetical protein